MILKRIHKLNQGFSGPTAGKPSRSRFEGGRGGASLFIFNLNLLCSYLKNAARTAGGLAVLLAVCLIPAAALCAPAQGDSIINNATISWQGGAYSSSSSVTVTIAFRTPSTIEALTYAPSLPGAQMVHVSPTAYRTGSLSTDPFVNLPAPVPVGTATPIDLSQPVPLTGVDQFHQGEPLFIRLTDLDQNLNPAAAEIVIVTVRNPASGDTEVIRLTETGPNTGVFAGYLPTGDVAATSYNGIISVKTGDVLNISYVDVVDGTDTSAAVVMVDPYGVVFDTGSGKGIKDAEVTIINMSTGLPATVYADDGITVVSSTVTTDEYGRFRFPFVLPGNYQFQITAPEGYGFPSTVETSVIQTLPGAPFTIVTGSRGEAFVVNPGPALRIDVPLDPAAASLWIQKTANKDSAGHGDFIAYRLTVINNSKLIGIPDVKVRDILPVGFRYRSGSARLNGVLIGNPFISSNGRNLTFNIGTLDKASSINVDYVVEVTAGTQLGDAINSAYAGNAEIKSNKALWKVKIRDDFLRTKSMLIGRVSTGPCDGQTGEGPDGVEGVRVYLEDGTFVISDKNGKFHFEAVRDGLHVVQLDLDSLPEGYEPYACTQNSRFAGRAFSQFVETQGGTLWRTDFHLRSRMQPAIVPETSRGEIVLELANTVDEKKIFYRTSMHGSAPVGAARLNVVLPEGVVYEKGSSMMDGAAVADPQVEQNRLTYRLNDLPAGWKHDITFRGIPSGDVRPGTLITQAYLAADGDGKAEVLTTPAETIVHLDKNVKVTPMPDIILRPHFPTRGADLNAEDSRRLDGLAEALADLHTDKIEVTGYTDNVPIAPKNRIYFADNNALSWARARSVGRYLMDKLHMPPEKLVLDGKGSARPVAGNSTEAGRALNRRVELRITASRVIDLSSLSVVKELSGEQRIETTSLKKDTGRQNLAPEPVTGEKQTSDTAVPAQPDADNKGQSEKPVTGASLSAGIPSDDAAPVGAKVAGQPEPEAIKAPASAATEESEKGIKEKEGILSPKDKDILINSTNSVRVCLDSRLTPRLLVDNQEVPAKQIGFTMKDSKAGKAIYSYIGVDFGKQGDHVVRMQGMDPFGNARFDQTISVKRSGEIVSIRLKSAAGNVADGKTPVKLSLELYDSDGTLIPAGAELEIREGTLSPLKQPDLFADPPKAGSFPRVEMSREGDALFNPVSSSGLYRVVLGYNKVTIEAETYVQPKMRDWILVGLAEGTAGYNTLSGNMENLKKADIDDDLYQDGRIAFFAKGQIKGKWLLTVAYDSDKTKENGGNTLFQTINPESYFTLYGDTSQQQYDAASTKKLYVKIEREQFYALFGDYDTGLTVTELSRYSRRMTGIKTELQTKNFELNAFASETDQIYMKDELPGDGTSGVYRLSRKNIVNGSEKITLEVRDRFRSEVLLSSRSMSRFTDYSIDYDAGTIIFREPVFSRDEQFNPVLIVAEYETISEGGDDYTYGGRAGVKLLDNRLKAGASYVHEGQNERSSDLYGVDATVKLDDKTKIRGEFAKSEYSAGIDSRKGNAYLVEASRKDKKYEGKAYIREQEEGFGLGQQPGSEAGTRKLGIEGAYRFNDRFDAAANVYRQYNLMTDATRDMAEGKFNYTADKYGASVGFLHAYDQLEDGSNKESNQITLGGRVKTLYDRLTLTLNHSQSIGNNDNVDFPTRTALGAELAVTKNLTLLAAQEFTWGATANTQNTRVGMRSTPWKGGTLNSSVERQFNENDERVFANVGVKQNWQINDAWSVDAGVERSQTVAEAGHYQFNTNVSPASGNVNSASGINDDFTAVSAGTTYKAKQLTWDNRLEYRTADSEDKWGLVSGLVKEIDNNWAWSGRLQLFQTSSSAGVDTTRADFRHGLVYRPPLTRWIALNRLDFIVDRQSGKDSDDFDSWRIVNNLMLNYRPQKQLQLSLHYGAKYVRDKVYDVEYSGYTDLIGAEGRYDINKYWDIGLYGSILHSWNASVFDYSSGLSVGYNIVQNAWLSLGYNFLGFEDRDFSEANFTAQGPFLRFRFKFDQESVLDAARWINGSGVPAGNTELMTGPTK